MKKVQVASIMILFALVGISFVVQPAYANPTSRWESLNTYMTALYNLDDEAGYTVPDSEGSRLYATYGGAMVLEEKGLLDVRPVSVDLVKMKNFTTKLQWKSGGEDYERWGGFSNTIAGTVSMENSYFAIKLWNLLSQDKFNDIPDINDPDIDLNYTSALVYVNKTQTTSGGFGNTDGGVPNLVSTFYALFVLYEMIDASGLTLSDWFWNETATIEYIMSCQEGAGFKLSPTSSIVSVTATAAGLKALELLGEISLLNSTTREAMSTWILERQALTDENGMFAGAFEESFLTNDTNMLTTYHALEALTVLGTESQVDESLIASFLMTCQAVDGSWATTPGAETGSLFNAGLVFEMLDWLDSSGTYFNLLNEEHPENPSDPLVDWRLIFVIGFLIAAMVVAVIAIRRD